MDSSRHKRQRSRFPVTSLIGRLHGNREVSGNTIPEVATFLSAGSLPNILPSLDQVFNPLSCISSKVSGDCEDAFGEDEQILAENCRFFVTLPRRLLFHAGLGSEHGPDVMLFMRPRCLTQILFMCEDVIRHNHIGHVYGQPGTGKSTTALYFASRLAVERQWNVLWAHLCPAKRSGYWKCLHMKPDGSYATASIASSDISYHINHFHTLADHNQVAGHLVILDGINSNCQSSPNWFGDLWADSAPNHRLMRISSDGVDCGLTGPERDEGRIRIFHQWSWTLAEYRCAIQNGDFYKSMGCFLDASSEGITVDEKIQAKYYLAGGSARWMLGREAEFVRQSIDSAIRRTRYGPSESGNSVSRLFSRFGKKRTEIVSEYAKWTMAHELGSLELKRLSQHPLIRYCGNSVDGHLFEAFFFHEAMRVASRAESLRFKCRSSIDVFWNLNGVIRRHISDLKECPVDSLVWPFSQYQHMMLF